MARSPGPSPSDPCHCLVVRQAGRWMTQFYDQHMAASGLSTSQFAMLSALDRMGPSAIAALADAMVMDRTTLTRNITPLERDGFVRIAAAQEDRRRRLVSLTASGREALARARPHWRRAQAAFEAHFGAEKAAAMRTLLLEVPAGEAADAQ